MEGRQRDHAWGIGLLQRLEHSPLWALLMRLVNEQRAQGEGMPHNTHHHNRYLLTPNSPDSRGSSTGSRAPGQVQVQSSPPPSRCGTLWAMDHCPASRLRTSGGCGGLGWISRTTPTAITPAAPARISAALNLEPWLPGLWVRQGIHPHLHSPPFPNCVRLPLSF